MVATVILPIDDQIGLAAAAKLMRGRGGKPPSIESLRRWANPLRGYRPCGPTGPTLVLQTVKLNGEFLTCERWVREFEAARERAGVRAAPPVLARPARSRAAAHRRAEEALDRAGVR